jgi:peptide methionine sulfoxide reductase msrA/msrB
MMSISHDQLQSAIFAGGCFWCVEADFKKRPNIKDIESGYTGGSTDNPSYETAAENGHREAVRVWYDPEETNYKQLVAHFFGTHDPTDPGGSFADRGYTYTSAIYYENDSQKRIAEQAIKTLEEADVFADEIVTEVLPAETFWPAEEYHQEYAEKNPNHYKRYKKASGRAEFIDAHKQAVYDALNI